MEGKLREDLEAKEAELKVKVATLTTLLQELKVHKSKQEWWVRATASEETVSRDFYLRFFHQLAELFEKLKLLDGKDTSEFLVKTYFLNFPTRI